MAQKTGMGDRLRKCAIILLLLWLGWHVAQPVDLLRSDLGCHVKNGELILQGKSDVLYKNYYSYTSPQYPCINTHWLFGVFCYIIWHHFGFTMLGFIYLIIELITFYIFFLSWQRYSSFILAYAIALLSFPLIAPRCEIRPEGISYLCCSLFCLLIDSFQQRKLKEYILLPVLGVLQIIWVNSHVFFVMGPILTFLFWFQAKVNREEQTARTLRNLFFLLIGACFINPSGIKGILVLLPMMQN